MLGKIENFMSLVCAKKKKKKKKHFIFVICFEYRQAIRPLSSKSKSLLLTSQQVGHLSGYCTEGGLQISSPKFPIALLQCFIHLGYNVQRGYLFRNISRSWGFLSYREDLCQSLWVSGHLLLSTWASQCDVYICFNWPSCIQTYSGHRVFHFTKFYLQRKYQK
jgi:hypothetical protein